MLVITGKGARACDGERGVLKRQVPQWLGLPEFRALVEIGLRTRTSPMAARDSFMASGAAEQEKLS